MAVQLAVNISRYKHSLFYWGSELTLYLVEKRVIYPTKMAT